MEKFSFSCLNCKIRGCGILKKCERPLLEAINEKKNCLVFHGGQPIVHALMRPDGIYALASGVAKLYKNGHKGRPFIFRLLKAGDFFGYRLDGDESPQQLMVDAVEDCTVCFIKKEDFEMVLENSLAVGSELNKAFQQELNFLFSKTCNLLQMNVSEKIALTLLHIAQAYNTFHSSIDGHTRVNLSRQDIADMAGTTKEQVSRTLSDFKDLKILNVSGKHFSVLDSARLKALAGYGAENSETEDGFTSHVFPRGTKIALKARFPHT